MSRTRLPGDAGIKRRWWLVGPLVAGLAIAIVAATGSVGLQLPSVQPAAGLASDGRLILSPLVNLAVKGPGPAPVAGRRPYVADSPWNTPLGPSPVYDERSAQYVTALSGTFGSDPTQFTMPVYEVAGSPPLKTVRIAGTFFDVTDGGAKLNSQRGGAVRAPIPEGAAPARGTDAQIVVWDRDTGDEWGFWRATANAGGTWSATNGYHYNTNWSGVPPKGFGSRGAGVPYLTGLIRPWEIAQGQIDHAIAFAYNYPNSQHVYPATKSDGDGTGAFADLPEGARLQLDPALTEADFDRWGLSPAGKIIARALQQYGMIVVDRGGHPKIYAEYEGTAHWNGTMTARTVSRIPYSAFRVLQLP